MKVLVILPILLIVSMPMAWADQNDCWFIFCWFKNLFNFNFGEPTEKQSRNDKAKLVESPKHEPLKIFEPKPKEWTTNELEKLISKARQATTDEKMMQVFEDYNDLRNDERTAVTCGQIYDWLTDFDEKYKDKWVTVSLNRVQVPGMSEQEYREHNTINRFNLEFCQGTEMLHKKIKYSKY